MAYIPVPNPVATLEFDRRTEIDMDLPEGFTQCPYEAAMSVRWTGNANLPILIDSPDMDRYMGRLPWPMEKLGMCGPTTAVYRRTSEGD